MTDEVRNTIIERLKKDTNEKLMQRFLWYINNWNPIDYDRCETYELIKAEILERMEGK